MNRDKYLEKRNQLLEEAKNLIAQGKVKEAKEKREEIEALDAEFEAAATEQANLEAMTNMHTPAPFNFTQVSEPENREELYRVAFFKTLQGKELTADEKVAYTSGSGSGGAVIPTRTAEEIITKLKERAPLLNEITLLQVAGNVTFAVEGTTNLAAKHTENAAITASADTLVSVSLGGYEICKLIQVSDTVSTMSINAFESWLVDMLVEAVADKISDYIINGTGSSQPAGIEKANATWGATNSVTVAANASLAAADVQALIGLLGGGYDPNAKFLMSKKTLFTSFIGLQDRSKSDIVTREGKDYFVYGYPVLIDARVADDTAYFGDLKKYVGNLAETVKVKTDFDIDSNSNKYLGVAIFDGKPALGEAFVKLGKATSS